MAIQELTQPIINPIAAFDSTKEHEITFIVIGGAQVTGNRIVISDNQTGNVVYNNTVNTMKLAHTIPANTLSNGGYYNAVIYTIDSSANESIPSTPVPFYCYSQPTLTITNIPATETIGNGTYEFQGNYLQTESEQLNSYQFILYDSNKDILDRSDIIYYQSDSSLAYTFVGMDNDTSYYVELKGQTVNNTEITSGLMYFTVRYTQPATFAIVDLINDCENGYIQISSNIVAIDGKSNPEPPIYIDDKEVDLRMANVVIPPNIKDDWQYIYKDRFDITYNSTKKINSLSVSTAEYWEIVYLPVSVEPNVKYKFVFDFYVLEDYIPFSVYDGIRVQILNNVTNSNNLVAEIAHTTVSNLVSNKTYEIEFVPTQGTIYIAFNFGFAADNQVVKVDISNMKLYSNNAWVKWDEGFNINNDFTMRVWGRDFNDYERIISLANKENTPDNPNKIEMKWMIADVIETLPSYTSVSGKNIAIKNGFETDIEDLEVMGNSEQISKAPVDLGTGNYIKAETTRDMYLDIQVQGNQEQETREGYNLINFGVEQANNVTYNEDGTVTINRNGGFSLNLAQFTIIANQTYRARIALISGTIKNSTGVDVINSSILFAGKWLSNDNYSTITKESDTDIKSMWINESAIFTNAKIKIWAYEGTEDKPFEQYGASPSIDYPSEIKTVGNNMNLFDFKTFFEETKNMATKCTPILIENGFRLIKKEKDYRIGEVGTNTGYLLSVQPHNIYTISTLSVFKKCFINFLNKDKSYIKNVQLSNLKEYTFTTEDNVYFLTFRFGSDSDEEYTDFIDIKLEKGTKATPYSPYNQGSVEINISNKNLFNEQYDVGYFTNDSAGLNAYVEGGHATNYISVGDNKTLYVLYKCLKECMLGRYWLMEFDENYNGIKRTSAGVYDTSFKIGNVIKEVKLSENCKYVKPSFYSLRDNGQTVEYDKFNEYFNISISRYQIEDYIRHQGQYYIMPVQKPMLTGDYISSIEHSGWEKIVIDNNTAMSSEGTAASGKYRYYTNLLTLTGRNFQNSSTTSGEAIAYSNMFKLIEKGGTYTPKRGFTIVGNVLVIYDEGESLDDFKQLLENNPLIIYVQLKTSDNLSLTDIQQTIQATLKPAYADTTNIYATEDLPILKVSTLRVPLPSIPSPIYSSGDQRNLLEDLGLFDISYTQDYFKVTDTTFKLKPNFVYNLSFDYTINNASTDLYFTVCYKNGNDITDITGAVLYYNQVTGRSSTSFMTPEDIPDSSTLSVKFVRTLIPANVNVSISNVQLEKGRVTHNYQTHMLHNIYLTAVQKNIFDYDKIYYIENKNTEISYIQNGISASLAGMNEPAYVAIGFPNILQPGQKYAISYNSYGELLSSKLYTMNKETGERIEEIILDNGSFTAPSNVYDFLFEFTLNDTIENNQVQIWNIQIETGDQITEYEVYKPNQTTITLDQPLRAIGNYKDIICLESPNLLNPQTQIASVKGGQNYYLSQSGTTQYQLNYLTEYGNLISSVNMASGRITVPDTCVQIKVNASSSDITSNKLQINEGTTAEIYYPYVSEPSVIRYCNEIMLDGNEDFAYDDVVNVNGVNIYQFSLFVRNSLWINDNIRRASSNYFLGIGYANSWLNNNFITTIGGAAIRFMISMFSTVADWKAWLKSKYDSGNPVIAEYVLSNPLVYSLSSENVSALKGLKTYDGNSNVFTNNNMPANINFSYISGQSEQEAKNAYVTLKCWNGNVMPYFVHSNYIDIPKETDKVFIWVRKKNNIFDLKIENLGDYQGEET